MSGSELRRIREEGGFRLKLDMLTDSFSIFSYLRSLHLKFPSERGTLFHLAHLREALVLGIVSQYTWCDTRDMVADGLTKGSVDRELVVRFMAGIYLPRHRREVYSALVNTSSAAMQS